MGGGRAEEDVTLASTPTWIVAVVCTIIIFISLLFERFLHRLGKIFVRKNQKPLFEALQKMKGELMVMGFISLLLVVSQGAIQGICIPASYNRHLRPCKGKDLAVGGVVGGDAAGHHRRRLLSGGSSDHCSKQGKVPLLSIEAIHDLHIFIFALAITHVILSVKTIALAGAKIHKWKFWEDSIHEETLEDGGSSILSKSIPVHEIKSRRSDYHGFRKYYMVLTWMKAFSKQFCSSLTKSDYRTMRLGFIKTHCSGNLKFNFYSYMVRALEADYKKVVGMSWYLWMYVIIFLLIDIGEWHEYFWLSFVPLILILAIGTKLELIIMEMVNEVAEKHSTIEGELVIRPSDHYFWFHRPQILLFCIHLILFMVSFQFAYFFCILIAYGYHSCIMDKTEYVVPRLIISFGVRIFASYSILPLYAIVTQMGSTFKPVIFNEHIKEGLIHWASEARKRANSSKSSRTVSTQKAEEFQIQSDSAKNDSLMEEGGAEIVEEHGPDSC
ncbi:MLO-like protein 1 [Platanthera zijinensis]|uniref:MLO-like protein n=1 Tax=Platanthera zijinensis TaxID=2320716 RepID=A0AAP0B0B6_9ASPA